MMKEMAGSIRADRLADCSWSRWAAMPRTSSCPATRAACAVPSFTSDRCWAPTGTPTTMTSRCASVHGDRGRAEPPWPPSICASTAIAPSTWNARCTSICWATARRYRRSSAASWPSRNWRTRRRRRCPTFSGAAAGSPPGKQCHQPAGSDDPAGKTSEDYHARVGSARALALVVLIANLHQKLDAEPTLASKHQKNPLKRKENCQVQGVSSSTVFDLFTRIIKICGIEGKIIRSMNWAQWHD